MEYIETPDIYLPMIQYKNYLLFMTDFEILINNSKEMMAEGKFEDFVKNLQGLREAEEKVGGFLKVRTNNIQKTQKYHLKPIFNDVLKIISKMRRDIVSCLLPILSPSAKDTSEDLPQ